MASHRVLLGFLLFGVQGFNLDMVEGWAFTLTLNLNPKRP